MANFSIEEKAKVLDILMTNFGLDFIRSSEDYNSGWLEVECRSVVRLSKKDADLVDEIFDIYDTML